MSPKKGKAVFKKTTKETETKKSATPKKDKLMDSAKFHHDQGVKASEKGDINMLYFSAGSIQGMCETLQDLGQADVSKTIFNTYKKPLEDIMTKLKG